MGAVAGRQCSASHRKWVVDIFPAVADGRDSSLVGDRGLLPPAAVRRPGIMREQHGARGAPPPKGGHSPEDTLIWGGSEVIGTGAFQNTTAIPGNTRLGFG